MNDTQYIETYLLNRLEGGEKLVAEARLLLDPELREKAHWQKQVYGIVRQYSRKQLKAEIEAVQHKLFTETKFMPFRKKISSIFKK